MKEKSQSKNYSELGSCPSLNSGRRPLLARNVGSSSNGDTLGEDAAIFGTGQDTGAIEEFVQTAKGRILIARHGDTKKPAIITYHDIGLNYLSNFQVIFNRITFNDTLFNEYYHNIMVRVLLIHTTFRLYTISFLHRNEIHVREYFIEI